MSALKSEVITNPLRWFGGKGLLRSRILPLLPDGQVYVEPYCGSAAVFFAKEPSPCEVLNDLNGDIVNFFRRLQDRETFEELRHRISYTPYARSEFVRALEFLGNAEARPVDRAWAFFVSQNQGFAGLANTPGRWGVSFRSRGGISG